MLTALVVLATLQLLLPDIGIDWFSRAFWPDDWIAEGRHLSLHVEQIPLVLFVIVGVIFGVAGASTREHKDATPTMTSTA